MTAEIAQLRQEVSELRTAVLALAFNEGVARCGLFNIPKQAEVAKSPDHLQMQLAMLCLWLGSTPTNSLNVEGADWLQPLLTSEGISQDQWLAKFRKIVEVESARRQEILRQCAERAAKERAAREGS